MKRIFFSLSVTCVLVSGTATMAAETEEQRAARCAAQAAVVTKAVELRLEDKREKRARKLVLKDDEIAGTAAESHVDLLVDWVYQLPEEQLGDQTAVAFEMACSQFSG